MFKLKHHETDFYIPVLLNGNNAALGMYLRQTDSAALYRFIRYLFSQFEQLQSVSLLHTFNPLPGVEQKPHWHIELPETVEEFDASLSHDIRYNSKYYGRKFTREVAEYEIAKFTVDQISDEVLDQYLQWKKESHNFIWMQSPRQYLCFYGVTHAYVMKTAEEFLAIGFTCETGENVYFENTTYNRKYHKYSLGTVLYYNIICDLILNHKKRFYLLGGNLEYKRNYNGVQSLTYSGDILRHQKLENFVHDMSGVLNKTPLPRCVRKMFAKFIGLFLFNKVYAKKLKGLIR